MHLFGNVAPIAEIEALGVPVSRTRRRPSGRRGPMAAPGALGDAGDALFYPSKNLGALRRRRRDPDRRRRRSPTRVRDAALPRLARQGHATSRSATTRAWTSCRPRSCASQLPHLDGWAAGRRGGRASPTRDAGLGELAALPGPDRGARPAWHLYVVRHARADDLAARARRRRHRRARLLPHARSTASRRCAACAAASSCPGPTRLARTHLAIPMSRARIAPRAGRARSSTRRARCGSGST